jgi:transcriptional regulator with XRE-family HTH domain
MTEKDTAYSDTRETGNLALKAFAERLESAMSAAGHNRRSLGLKINVHYNTVGFWTRAKRWPDVEPLGRLAVALNVSVDWLLTGRDPATSPRGAMPANVQAVQLARELSTLAPQLSQLAKRAQKVAGGS